MPRPDPSKVAARHVKASMSRTAGEVRFVKDRGSDKNEWGWGSPGPVEREIHENFVFNAKYLKPLAFTMRSALMALGHATSAHARFVKIKSRNVSPDGNLGGKGYIAKIPEMRRQLMNVVEALSALTDTIYDELQAPHWNKSEDTLSVRDRDEVKDIIEESEEIKEDPEGWAREEEAEEFGSARTASMGRTASLRTAGMLFQDMVRRAEWLHSIDRDLEIMASQGIEDPRVGVKMGKLIFDLEESRLHLTNLLEQFDV